MSIIDEFERITEKYQPLEPPCQPPLSPGVDPLDICLRGAKKLEEDSELKEILREVYQGK